MTGISIRRWAGALTAVAAMLAGCGGGSSDVPLTAQAAPLVYKLEGRVQPTEADQGVPGLRSRSAVVVPVPTKVRLGPLNNEKGLSLSDVQGRQQIGVARDVIGTKSAAQMQQQLQWKSTSIGGQVAAISFSAEGAFGLRLGVLVKQISGSAQIRVYRQADVGTALQISGHEVLQHIERNAAGGDNTLDGQTWWTPDLGGDEVTLEIELPPGTAVSTLDVSVPRVSHVFEDLSARAEEDISIKINESSSCHLDASCYETYVNQRNAVARMVFVSGGKSYLCTGTLLNNTQSSGAPYFLTANHCISTQSEASSLQTDWFYRAPACNSRTLSASTARRVGGAQLLYTSNSNDMTLLRLNDTPPAGAYFAGWDASSQTLGQSVVGLHHPAGDLLKASFGTLVSQATCTSQSGDIFCGGTSGNFYRVNWTQGTTQGGSSGSAIFKDGVYVIGTLYAGGSSCTSLTAPDYYGRFDIGFNEAIQKWLVPSALAGGRTAVYRFYNATTGAHFFTASADERNSIIKTLPLFAYEGVAFYVYSSSGSGLSPVYRFFNTQGGSHFYTISATERDSVRANLPVYQFEGASWYAKTANDGSTTPIFRFYRQSSKTHFYTVSAAERDSLVAGNADYTYEGPAYYVWSGF